MSGTGPRSIADILPGVIDLLEKRACSDEVSELREIGISPFNMLRAVVEIPGYVVSSVADLLAVGSCCSKEST